MDIFLRKIDIFGQVPSFNFKSNKVMTSALGGIFTLMMLGFGIFILYFFGRELLRKSSPTVNISKINQDHPNPINVSQTNFNLIMMISSGGDVVKTIDQKIYYLDASLVKIGDGGRLTFEKIAMVPCSQNNYTDPLLIQNSDLSQIWCIAQNQTELSIQGIFGNEDFHMLQFQFYPCKNSTNSIICKSQEAIDDFFNGAFFSLNTYDFLIQTNNYTYPYQKVLKNLFFTVSNKYSTSGLLFVNQADIVSDKGLLLEESKVETFYQIDNFRDDLQITSINGLIALFSIQYSNVKYVYNRKYQKIQDILAQVGGFLNVVNIVFEIIYSSYRNHVFFEEISTSHFKMIKKPQNKTKINLENEKSIQPVNESAEKNYEVRISSQQLKNNYFPHQEIQEKIEIFSFDFSFIQKFFCLSSRGFCLPINSSKLDIFKNIRNIIEKKLDIMSYFDFLFEIEKLRFVLFDHNQIKILELIKNYYDLDLSIKEKFDPFFDKLLDNETKTAILQQSDVKNMINELKKRSDLTSQRIVKFYEFDT